MTTERKFEFKDAARAASPAWIALAGPSGSGKSLSALRLAAGIQQEVGGGVAFIDTEADRGLYYAPRPGAKAEPPKSYNFKHTSFMAPFGPLDYLAVIQEAIRQGAKTVVVDSFSYEHVGVGGVLEQFEMEIERIAGNDYKKAERVKMLAWKKPKMERDRMITSLLQLKVNIIGCFRTKQKLKPIKGGEPVHLGYMPITGYEFIFEFPTRFLLLPQSDGRPTWESSEPGEKEWIRLPEQFRGVFRDGAQLSEEHGRDVARWYAGGDAVAAPAAPTDEECDAVVAAIEAADAADVKAIVARERKKPWTQYQRDRIRRAIDASTSERGEP
jgi:energy-coupling factor transporter ATP-binding protein EcfA2